MSHSALKIVQVVKRFGPVGGMERYVWELAHALAGQGVEIVILCEKAYQQPDSDSSIRVICLGETRPKPRWISMLRFSARVTRAVKAHKLTPENGWIIHSHERTGVHQVTTFHGPPMAPIKSRKRLWWTSPRLICWLWLERRELEHSGVRNIVPNSTQIADSLARYYPNAASRLDSPGWPGVNRVIPSSGTRAAPDTVLFVGKECLRKGLDVAVAACEKLRETRPGLRLVVVGPDPQNIPEIAALEWVDCRGWVENLDYRATARVLFHPARNEPYGMVIAEALAAGLGVLASTACGAVDHYAAVSRLPAESSISDWATYLESSLAAPPPAIDNIWTWNELAEQHLGLHANQLQIA